MSRNLTFAGAAAITWFCARWTPVIYLTRMYVTALSHQGARPAGLALQADAGNETREWVPCCFLIRNKTDVEIGGYRVK
jgi:hypothetical protein